MRENACEPTLPLRRASLRGPFRCAPGRRLAHDEHRAVVCVTHDAGFAEAADRRIHMIDGRIVAGA